MCSSLLAQELPPIRVETDLSADSKALSGAVVGGKVRLADSADPKVRKRDYKVLKIERDRMLHVQFIALGSSRHSISAIDSLRGALMTQLQAGSSFGSLAEQYTMEPDGTIDTGWKSERQFAPAFADAVMWRSAGDLFNVDVPDAGWYYLVRKMEEDRMVRTYCLEPLPEKKTYTRIRIGGMVGTPIH